ncbi:hypothetical protein RRG08_056412 [Elysia crispata]|uniref:Uncharacterized protein n=1 Tax=Elysia crispata TaxID=231223 RepID=A0AAE0Z1I6_9GAST|nr:hypothetical protein RRG08_056412 [Elysia crispata]
MGGGVGQSNRVSEEWFGLCFKTVTVQSNDIEDDKDGNKSADHLHLPDLPCPILVGECKPFCSKALLTTDLYRNLISPLVKLFNSSQQKWNSLARPPFKRQSARPSGFCLPSPSSSWTQRRGRTSGEIAPEKKKREWGEVARKK